MHQLEKELERVSQTSQIAANLELELPASQSPVQQGNQEELIFAPELFYASSVSLVDGDMATGGADPISFSNMADLPPTSPPMRNLPSEKTQSSTLADELRELTLEATAERHLGHSSGMSFAILVQQTMSQSAPGEAQIVSGNHVEDDSAPLWQAGHDESTTSGVLDFMINTFANDRSYYPGLQCDAPLPAFTEPSSTQSELTQLDKQRLNDLVDFYFAHSHTLYPILDRAEFLSVLAIVREDQNALYAQCPLYLFRIWMVLAIGATTYCSVTLEEESEPVSYYTKAIMYFEAALGYGHMVCAQVFTLLGG